MLGGTGWPALLTLASGVANLLLVVYLRSYLDRPGAGKFVGVLACQALWSFAYGTALVVADRSISAGLEGVVWVAVSWIGVFYLAFALEYTGRAHLLGSWWFRAIVAFEALSTVVVATNGIHHLVWRDFGVEPVLGAQTAAYVHGPWVFVQYGALFLLSTFAVFVLLDTVVSYGPLYRTQAIAVALTPLPPAVAFTLWTFEVGPVPRLNLTPVAFIPHVALDAVALFHSDMFEFEPSTRRRGERAALDDLGTPVVIVDQAGRIVRLNDAARTAFGAAGRSAVARPLRDLLDGDTGATATDGRGGGLDGGASDHGDGPGTPGSDGSGHASDPFGGIDPSAPDGTVVHRRDGTRREFAVTATPLSGGPGGPAGYTLVFQDVTAERRRKQRLEVLNRVLRHNLRNDLNAVEGYLQLAEERVEDEAVREMLATAGAETADLLALGEKARETERAMAEAEAGPEPVELRDHLSAVVDGVRSHYPDARVTVDVPPDVWVRTNPRLLEAVVANLVENALEHVENPTVVVSLAATDAGAGTATVEVRDDGPGIPESELAAVEAGGETSLEHGSGLGLWLVTWAVEALGGDVSFAADDDGTTTSVTLPGLLDGKPDPPDRSPDRPDGDPDARDE